MAWALLYWNARKSWFVWRGRSGQCPCQNASDSGRPMETGCEAVLGWRRPARFRRVCPLLSRNAAGAWVCSVAPARVRSFWGRALGFYGGLGLGLILVAGLGVFGAMRVVGYRVTPRQVFWPPAWSELRAARVQLFLDRAGTHYGAGRMREALAALRAAHELAPDDYATGMTLAQFYQVAGPELADGIYLHLSKAHPTKRAEIARVWFASLLARGRLADVAALARRQLVAGPAEQRAVWTHALLFAARHLGRPQLLEEAAADLKMDAAVRSVLALEAQVRRLPRTEAVRRLRTEPWPPDFLYARLQRTELLIEFGASREAIDLLRASPQLLAGRDVMRLALRAWAAERDDTALRRETGALLAPGRKANPEEITLLAGHLIQFPDALLLQRVAEALGRLDAAAFAEKRVAYVSVLCAAGAARDQALVAQLRQAALAGGLLTPGAAARLTDFFKAPPTQQKITALLPSLQPLTIELNYCLLDQYAAPAVAARH